MFGDAVGIDVTIIGEGEPELTIVGGIHGDEPSGVRAIRRIIEAEPDLARPVQCIVANPAAAVTHRRYLDVDMNRHFPGDYDAATREERLAAQLSDAVDGTMVLSIHSTHSSAKPFAFVSEHHPNAQALAATLPVEHVIDHGSVVDGAFTSCRQVVSVEAGRQLSDAATQNAARIVRSFLRLSGALPGDATTGSPDFYSLTDSVAKPGEGTTAQLLVDNFSEVEAGETYLTTEDEEYVADDPFRPVLMSETGYEDIFGYKGRKVGDTLAEAREEWALMPG